MAHTIHTVQYGYSYRPIAGATDMPYRVSFVAPFMGPRLPSGESALQLRDI